MKNKMLLKENPAYWERAGMTTADAITQSLKYKGYRSKWCPNYYIHKGHPEDDAIALAAAAKLKAPGTKQNRLARFGGDEVAYTKWVGENCALSKTNMLAHMTEEEYISKKRELGYSYVENVKLI